MTDYTEKNERQSVYLQRTALKSVDDIEKAIAKSYKQVNSKLIDFYDVTNLRDLNKLTNEIRAIIRGDMIPAWEQVTDDYNKVAIANANFAANALMSTAAVVLSIPFDEQIERAVNTSIMSLKSGDRITAGLWGDFVNNNVDSMTKTYNSIIVSAYQAGKTNQEAAPTINQISKQLRNVSNNLLRSQAETLARTGIVHFAAQGQRAMANRNKDIIVTEYPIVTFDNRTSDICIYINENYLDGWPLGKSPIGYPAFHCNCRTVIGYLTKGQNKPEGSRTALGGQSGKAAADKFEDRENRLRTASQVRYRGKKDLDTFKPESIKADSKFSGWLRKQPTWFIEDTLGKKKAELFISGELSLKNITDRNLQPLTVNELLERID